MNKGFFTGRIAKTPIFRDGGKTPVCYFTLILNEYAGKDDAREDQERKVAVPFTAFGKKGAAIAEHAYVGDQLIIQYRLANNDREQNDQVEYGLDSLLMSSTSGLLVNLNVKKGHRRTDNLMAHDAVPSADLDLVASLP